MRQAAGILIVFLAGFVVMVLEIIGARFLARDFGSSFYVWVSQIGVVLAALAVGYGCGGALADRLQRLGWLALLLVPSGLVTYCIPWFEPPLVNAIIQRHPADAPISALWQKLDPALGSALVFFLPCAALAAISPYMIRVAARQLTSVGRISGLIYAASTVGSIAGVFISGYVLIEQMTISNIFRTTGVLTVLLGVLCWVIDGWFGGEETGP
ncbi:MAG: hypothetical protein C5B50_18105 [Verrucomicrobia bacterium]|nr:MAG: hypothetical protein C5B50_18105 [Verrucomicrobiota bacterium]